MSFLGTDVLVAAIPAQLLAKKVHINREGFCQQWSSKFRANLTTN